MRILVLGAYGLIGTHVVSRLLAAGYEVAGLGRDVARAARRFPSVHWMKRDIAELRTPEQWAPVLREARAQAIVNCAGALQDGARDRVGDVQSGAIRALIAAATQAGIARFVQISAGRADPAADTAFMRSKGEADRALQQSALDWTILRPGLVLSPQAYGGTALLRALAAVPWVQPVTHGESLVQTVSADDVARAVLAALEGRVPSRRAYDLVEDEAHTLVEVLAAMRGWLGLPPAPFFRLPSAAAVPISRIADGLGWLGWRSPLRSTAVTELSAGVGGDPAPWRAATGRPLAALAETLAAMPSTVQERWFARTFLLKPAMIAVLALFWAASGAIGLAQFDAASRVLTDRGVGEALAAAVVAGGAVVDVALGIAVLFRSTLVRAAQGMIALSLAYLAGGTIFAPNLWLDPVGPLMKVIPALMLPLVVLALAEDR